MRKAYSKQRRLDSVPIDQVELNLDCRDSIIPVLRALQQVYSDWTLTEKVLDLVGQDVNGNSRTDCGREGMDYWHLLVLASVRLGCNLTYDQLHDLPPRRNGQFQHKKRAIVSAKEFEPHTQLYKRGKAGEPVQFGRQIFQCRRTIRILQHPRFRDGAVAPDKPPTAAGV